MFLIYVITCIHGPLGLKKKKKIHRDFRFGIISKFD